MRRLSILGLSAAAGLLAACLLYSRWPSPEPSGGGFFENGVRCYGEKKFGEASVQFLNVLQKVPRDRNARYLLALCYLKQLEWTRAVSQLQIVLEHHPDDVQASLLLGNLYLTGGRNDRMFFREARGIGERIRARLPQSVRPLVVSGNSMAGLQDLRSSIDLVERALSLDPGNVAAYISLGMFRAFQKDYREAERAFLKAREIAPKNKDSLLSLAIYYQATGNTDKAEAAFTETFSLFPTDGEIYRAVVRFYRQLGRFEAAERILREVESRAPQLPEAALLQVDLDVSRNRLSEARKRLLELKEKFAGDLDVARRIALALIKIDPEHAREAIDWIRKVDRGGPAGSIVVAELQFHSGQYEAAEATLAREPVSTSGRPDPHFLLGRIAFQKGQDDAAQILYQKALALDESYLPARVGLAEVCLRRGNVADLREELRRVFEVDPDYFEARLLQATLDTIERNHTEAQRELLDLEKENPGNARVHRQLGLYYQERGPASEAEKHFTKALELQPDWEDALLDLAQFYMKERQIERGLQVVRRVAEDKRRAFHYEVLGRLYLEAREPKEAEIAFRKAIEKDPGRERPHLLLMDHYVQCGRWEEGLEEIDALLKKRPSDARLHGLKGFSYQNQGKIAAAEQAYRQALRIDRNLAFAANSLACILMEQDRDLDAALQWAQVARREAPDNADHADTLGWAYYKTGNYVLALDQLRFAVSRRPESPVFLYHLGMACWKRDQRNEAKVSLKRALDTDKGFKERSLAEAALKELAKGTAEKLGS